ncbi:DUF3570 domain-containing protein [Ferrimonas marina]|uniref:DUF3570 domain-containing protein n=1 Tax=Ferrimonas marina TaxID=299255 RepID=A0A1M5NRR5_9GAMM|nr:DUF3570 domain-containing protein [Ferrimonas marina]SHG92266.1 Protein of unknown function [Ferrimonas marina]
MQLKPQLGNISAALAAASSALVSPAGQAGLSDWFEDLSQWQVNTALLYYGEDGDRVTAWEGTVQAQRTNGDQQTLSLAATLDSLTGASATGAVPQDQVQTFTRPSGNGEYQVAPGQTPLDDTFKDTRLQLNIGWAEPISIEWEYDLGGHLSKEYDYLSLGLYGGATRYFDRNNTALRFGASVFYDTIEPEGDIPVPFSAMALRADYDSEEAFRQAFDQTRGAGSDTKTTAELTLGLTQVINPALVMQLNYSYAQVSGYQTDPFKFVSEIDDTGTALVQRYERRPDRRSKHALFAQAKAHLSERLGGPVLDASYRFMTDDWGIDSHTLDLRYNLRLANGHFIEPQLRLYRQTAAEFYRPFLRRGEPLPDYASADYRLADMDTYTLGLKYGIPLSQQRQADIRVAYYRQQPSGPGGPGQLQSLELYPALSAWIVQLSYRF